MSSALFLLAAVSAGVAAARALERDTDAGPAERAASVGVASLAVAIAVDWGLALAHGFTRGGLVVASIALLATSLRGWRGLRAGAPPLPVLAALLPLAVWAAYVSARSVLVAPYTADSMAYHLPKALLVARTHGYAAFDGPDARLTTMPANYELLL